MKQNNLGFTLIELLVVISIIGMMASVTLVSLNSARDKGRIASGLMFATTMNRGWGAYAIGSWSFDEASSTDAQDSGANNITLTHYGASTRSPERPGTYGSSITYSGVAAGNTTDFFMASGLNTKNINLISGGGYTVSLWVNRLTGGVGKVLYVIGSNELTPPYFDQLALINLTATQIFTGPRSTSSATNYFSYAIPENKWVHLSYSFNSSSNTVRLYVDGKFYQSRSITPGMTNYTLDKVLVGVSPDSSTFPTPQSGGHYTGLVDEISIYPYVLSADNIQQIYANGVKRHSLAFTKASSQ